MEEKLLVEGRHMYNATLAAKLRVLSDIFSARSREYNGIDLSLREFGFKNTSSEFLLKFFSATMSLYITYF